MKFLYFLKTDFLSSIVVFLVALPLCLGIALASGAPLMSGVLSGIIGGVVVGAISKSPLSVSGPAAGLVAVVALGIQKIGSFEGFLVSLIIAGIIQVALGYFKAGTIGQFFPGSVVLGMLAAIGIILIVKQIPHLVGDDLDFLGDEAFLQGDQENTFTEIFHAFRRFSPGALFISLFSILTLIFWDSWFIKNKPILQNIPGSIVAVIGAILLHEFFVMFVPSLSLNREEHFVLLPPLDQLIVFPDFSVIWEKSSIWMFGVTMAIIASLESLLSVDASDKLDPEKRHTPLNRELIAQGVGNILGGFLGGLPVTAVIVRSLTNIQAGAKTKLSTISHGVILLLSILLFPRLLERIPLAALASILLIVGYKLASIALFKEMYRKGILIFLPFIVTVFGVLVSDLLGGVVAGIIVSSFIILTIGYKKSIIFVNEGNSHLIKFVSNVTFLNKSTLNEYFRTIAPSSQVVIDGTGVGFIDHDIVEAIRNFQRYAAERNISVEIKNITQEI